MVGLPAATLIGGGISAAGGLAATGLNLWSAKRQQDFQEKMSNTAYQRQVVDMRAAGINPMLAAMKGGGASTPPGARAEAENVLAPLGDSVSAASRMKNLELVRVGNESKLAEATAAEKASNVLLNAEQMKEIESRIKLQALQGELAHWSAKAAQADIPRKDAISQLMRIVGRFAEGLNKELDRTKGTKKAPFEDTIQGFLDTILGEPDHRSLIGGGGPPFWRLGEDIKNWSHKQESRDGGANSAKGYENRKSKTGRDDW